MSYYRNKKVWVTGASSGIGKAISLLLASQGACLYLSSENETELTGVAAQCRASGAKVNTIVLDQSDSAAVEKACNQLIGEGFIPNILILNAGISQRASLTDTSMNVHDRIMQINFRSNVQITGIMLPQMIVSGGGHIGVTSSISGKFGFHLRSSYAASKHALHGFFESAGIEYRKQKIFVTIVCPGRVKTNISLHALAGDGTPHGKMDDGQQGGISPEKCAKKYLKAIKNKRREKLIGGKEILMALFKRYIPGLFYFLAGKIKPV